MSGLPPPSNEIKLSIIIELNGNPVSHQVELRVKSRDDVKGVFSPCGVPRSGRDDHDLVEDEDAVGAARQLEGRLRHHLQVAVVHRQDRSLGEDARQNVQVARGALHAESERRNSVNVWKRILWLETLSVSRIAIDGRWAMGKSKFCKCCTEPLLFT